MKAYPKVANWHSKNGADYQGLDMVDYFAIRALQALINEADAFWPEAVVLAYKYGDAMVEERERRLAPKKKVREQ